MDEKQENARERSYEEPEKDDIILSNAIHT